MFFESLVSCDIDLYLPTSFLTNFLNNRLKQLKEEKERAEKERKLAKEKAKREIAEQEMRVNQLSYSCEHFHRLKEQIDELDEKNRAAEEVGRLHDKKYEMPASMFPHLLVPNSYNVSVGMYLPRYLKC